MAGSVAVMMMVMAVMIVMRWRVTMTPDEKDIAPLRRHRHLRTHGQ
jgi:hypothetical protein